MTSLYDYKNNLKNIENYMKEASVNDASFIFLPECYYSMSDGNGPTKYLVSKDNEHFVNIQNLCKKYKLGILGGSVAYLDEKGIVRNRSLNFDQQGKLIGEYDKTHLFSCQLKERVVDEGDVYTAGDKPLILNIDGIRVGIAICFDLRFSKFLNHYFDNKVDIISFSSAFTLHTGKAHWHTLLRARAIEGQCYVVASAQVGANNEKFSTYGHSLVVDPWGSIKVDLEKEVGLEYFEIDEDLIQKTRDKIIMKSNQ